MTVEMVRSGALNELEAVSPAQREAAVTLYLSQARDQLAHAVEMTGPAAVAALKAEIATAAEATKQLGLSKEIQQDAQEMVRRAEYALGKAIRAGQEAGTVRITGQTEVRYSSAGLKRGATETDGAVRLENSSVGVSPRQFLPHGQEMSDVYTLSEAPPEEFESALNEARAEENVSRANVVRKVQGLKSEKLTPAERLNKIGDMADAGHTSDQIAKAIGHGEDFVKRLAKENGIEVPGDRVMRGTRRINHTKFVAETVAALEGLSSGLDVLDLTKVDPSQIDYWATSLTDSLRALNRLAKQIKEMTQ